MSAEVAKGIFGRKGAGKSHELVRLCIHHLRAGRRVCIVMPQLDKDKVVKYLGDPGVADRLTVCGYKDLLLPNFFPNEAILTDLQLWRRFQIDYASEEPQQDSPRNEIPSNAWRWKESIFRPGDVLIIDEAWRVMRNEDKCPPGLRTALHMARHWYGPADWRDPAAVERYMSDTWFPGLGGPEWNERKVVDDKGKVVRVEQAYAGGDGTEIVASNLIISSQRFQGLAKNLREQLDTSSLLVAVQTRYLPRSVQKLMSKKAQYTAFSFESEHVPTWREMDRALDKKDKIWDGRELIDHVDELHELYTYNSGQAREDAADDKLDFKNSPAYKEMRRGVIFLVLMLAVGAGLAVLSANMFEKSGGISGPQWTGAQAKSAGAKNVQAPTPPPLLFAGRVGGVSVVMDGEKFVPVDSSETILNVNGRSLNVEKDVLSADRLGPAARGGGDMVRDEGPQRAPKTAANGLPDVKSAYPARYTPGRP